MKQGYLIPIREQLMEEFIKGQRVTLVEVVKTIEDETGKDELGSYRAAVGLLTRLKIKLAANGYPLVRLPDGNYGVPKTKEEVIYAMSRYGQTIELIIAHANVLKKYATTRNLLPKNFVESTIKLPAFVR